MKKLLGILLTLGLMVFLVPTAMATSDVYSVEKLYFSDLFGTELENPTQSCLVNVEVKKLQERAGTDDVIISSYATDGSLIGFTVVSGTINNGQTSTFRTLVEFPADKTLGMVKAYVWDSFVGMQALSNTVTVEVSEVTPPEEEKYIPDVITVYGRVEETPRSNPGLDPGKYSIRNMYIPVDYSSAHNEEEYYYISNRYTAISNYYGIPLTAQNSYGQVCKSEIDLNSYLFCEGNFTVKKDEDGNIVILSFEPKKSNFVTVNAEDYISSANGGKNADTDWKITFGSKNYSVNSNTGTIYVNGVNYGSITEHNVSMVLGLAQGEVKLIDDDDTDTGYDKIMVTVYDIAKVWDVTYENGITTIQVTTKAGLNSITSIRMTDDGIEDGYTAFTVKNADGEDVSLSSIKKDDIIAFATEPYSSATITDPSFIDIIVTDKKVTGIVTMMDEEEQIYAIGEEEYKEVVWGAPYLMIGWEYIISLDPFGRIYEEEVIATPTKYAIAEKYDFDLGIQLILPDGTAKWYEVDEIMVEDDGKMVDGTSYSINLQQFETYIETTKANKPEERVVKYLVKKSGKITSIALIGTPATTMTYKAGSGKLGNKTITDRTAVIDASNYCGNVSDYKAFAVSSFKNITDYEASVFDLEGSFFTAAFIVLTDYE